MVILVLILQVYTGASMSIVQVPSYGDLEQNIARCHRMGNEFVHGDNTHRTYQCLTGDK